MYDEGDVFGVGSALTIEDSVSLECGRCSVNEVADGMKWKMNSNLRGVQDVQDVVISTLKNRSRTEQCT